MPLIADNQVEINLKKFAKPPTAEQIDNFLKEIDIKQYRYERIVGMRRGTFHDAKIGYRSLPIKYWHLVYNKIIPTPRKNALKKQQRQSTRKCKVVYNVNQSTEITKKLLDLK